MRIARGLIVLAACSTPPRRAPPAPKPAEPAPLVQLAESAVPAAARQRQANLVVVESPGAASRQPERPRVLRKLLADRGGKLELARGYGRVGLTIERIVSGTLDDPDYPKRPVGTNHLPVVLIDEAAFVTGDDLDGFAGRWTLTRTDDGILVVGLIGDTPWPVEKVANRQAMIDKARKQLRSDSSEQRLAGLAVFDTHLFYELAPDVIALLDDTPQQSQRARVVSYQAHDVMRALARPFADDRTPATGNRAEWEKFWKQLLTPETTPRRTIDSEPVVLADPAMSQNWPVLAPLPEGGFALGLERLDRPFDGHTEGIALTYPPFHTRTWIASTGGEALDVQRGSDGTTAVLHVTADSWKLALAPPNGKPRRIDLAIQASHAALGATAKGYVVAYIKGDSDELVHFQLLDAAGKPGKTHQLKLPGRAQGRYHHGVFPLALAKRPGGWFVAVESAPGGTTLFTLDDNFAQVGGTVPVVDPDAGIAEVRISVGTQSALLVWENEERGRAAKVGHLAVDLRGNLIAQAATTGFDVGLIARPIALDDGGFAVAWCENEVEVHVGRWSAKGVFEGSAIVQPRGAIDLVLSLTRDGKDVIVAYDDGSKFPYALVARRIDPTKLGIP